MDIKESIRIFKAISELELYNIKRVEKALKEILTKSEEERREAWNEGYECARDEFSEYL